MRVRVAFESPGKRRIGGGDRIGEALPQALVSGDIAAGHGGFPERARAIAGTSVAPVAAIRTAASTIRVILSAKEPVTLARSADATAARARHSDTRAAPAVARDGLVMLSTIS